MSVAHRPKSRKKPKTRTGPARVRKGFVGRDPSPVLDRYPPKDPGFGRPPPALAASAGSTAPGTPAPASPAGSTAPPPPATSTPLITLDRPFDLDEFSSLLGGTSIRVTVPRDSLLDVLQRVSEFMDFGIYVYAITIRPAPTELLKSFVVELQRVDYSAEKGSWTPFVEKGLTDTPFGPTGDRR